MQTVYVELAIGLALAFFLLSLLVSGMQEGINRVFAIRAKFLWAYLRDLFDPPATGPSRLPTSLVDVLIRLPFNKITTLDGKVGDPRPLFGAPPPEAVVAAEPAPRMPTDDLYRRLRGIDYNRPGHNRKGRTGINHIPPARFAVALLELVEGRHAGNVPAWLDTLEEAGSPARTPLAALWRSTTPDLEKFRLGVERWFDGEMERLSRHYRRNVRWVIGILAVLVTLFVGLDAIAYGKTLLTDETFRTEVVAVASGDPGQLDRLRDRCAALTGPEADRDPYRCVDNLLAEPAVTTLFRDALVAVTVQPTGTTTVRLNAGPWFDRLASPAHWLGYLMTIVALLFGGPFWWDVLRRLSGVRARRTPPAA
jgi:hypothetical protein